MGQIVSMGDYATIHRARFSKACAGKFDKEGGMGTEELQAIASEKGVQYDGLGRRALINRICPPKNSLSRIKIEYIPPELFLKRFPQGEVLGQGNDGEVFRSGDYAVKKATKIQVPNASVNTEIIREMNFYASMFHPCIVRPVAWAYIDPFTYVVMPVGVNIIHAYKEGLITIEQIVSDTLSAIAYMNSLGIAHCDIKPSNMIFHDGHAKIIDMGFARHATIFQGNTYKIKGVSYSEMFRDPEYVQRVWNPINVELYALAKAYYEILGGDCTSISNMYSFSATDTTMDWFFSKAKMMNNERPSTYELLDIAPKHLIVRKHVGEELDTPEVPFNDYCKDCPTCAWDIRPEMLAVVCNWLVGVCEMFNYTARTLFAGLHLIQRTVHVVKDNKTRLQLLGAVCMYLAATIFEENVYSVSNWCNDAYNEMDFNDMMIEIIISSNCIISGPTPWDYAKYAEDLPAMMNDIIKCDYDPMHTRLLSSVGTSKNISVKDLYVMLQSVGTSETDSEEPSSIHPSNIIDDPPGLTVVMDEPEGWRKIIDDHRSHKYTPITLDHFSKLIYARNILSEMDINDAHSVFTLLHAHKEDFFSGIDKLFHFDWSNTSSEQLRSQQLHPFRTRQADLELMSEPSLSTVLDEPNGWRALISMCNEYRHGRAILKPVILNAHVSKLLYAKDILSNIQISDARSVYALLRRYKDKFKEEGSRLFNFDWYNTSSDKLYSLNLHPFKATQADLGSRHPTVTKRNMLRD